MFLLNNEKDGDRESETLELINVMNGEGRCGGARAVGVVHEKLEWHMKNAHGQEVHGT